MGAHLVQAAQDLELRTEVLDSREAYASHRSLGWLDWHLRGHRPTHLEAFGDAVVAGCQRWRPRWLVATGLAPLSRRTLEAVGRLGVYRANFLTDDPWNPAHRAPWFLEALPGYDAVFTPRAANIADLRAHGCREISYLPFGYAPEVHFPEASPDALEAARLACDVAFIGGADADRRPALEALCAAGFAIAVYGGGWGRWPATRAVWGGTLPISGVRHAVAAAAVNLCLVRRANRDGHAMRSYELPAMGACLLAEDTEDHRRLFGPEATAALYFRSIPEMLEKAAVLLADAELRQRLAAGARAAVTSRPNTYSDRLAVMLGVDRVVRWDA